MHDAQVCGMCRVAVRESLQHAVIHSCHKGASLLLLASLSSGQQSSSPSQLSTIACQVLGISSHPACHVSASHKRSAPFSLKQSRWFASFGPTPMPLAFILGYSPHPACHAAASLHHAGHPSHANRTAGRQASVPFEEAVPDGWIKAQRPQQRIHVGRSGAGHGREGSGYQKGIVGSTAATATRTWTHLVDQGQGIGRVWVCHLDSGYQIAHV